MRLPISVNKVQQRQAMHGHAVFMGDLMFVDFVVGGDGSICMCANFVESA